MCRWVILSPWAWSSSNSNQNPVQNSNTKDEGKEAHNHEEEHPVFKGVHVGGYLQSSWHFLPLTVVKTWAQCLEFQSQRMLIRRYGEIAQADPDGDEAQEH